MGIINVSWRSDMYDYTCYEIYYDGASKVMPQTYKNVKPYSPYGSICSIEGLAKYRKDHMGEEE
jgi:hypothetical protein